MTKAYKHWEEGLKDSRTQHMLIHLFWPFSIMWPPKWVHNLLRCRKKKLKFILIFIFIYYILIFIFIMYKIN